MRIQVACIRQIWSYSNLSMKFSTANKNSGVTLIELMIVIVIVGIIAGLAVPQYGSLISRKALLSESYRITSLLKLARSESRARGTLVTVARLDTGWGGQLAVTEVVATGDDEEIKISAGRGNLSVDASFDEETITFNPRGWVQAAFTIGICSSATDNTNGRLISVNRVGKITEGPLEDESCSQ